MSSTGYLILAPLGLIALSAWWVRHEDKSFNSGSRTVAIQIQSHRPKNDKKPVTVEDLSPSLRFDSERYGARTNDAPNGTNLGRDVVYRPLGERADHAPEWLDKPLPQKLSSKGSPSKIPDYKDAPPPADPLDVSMSEEGGYNIVADEVTKIEMGKHRVVFSGHVRMKSPQFYLTSNQLVVFLGKDASTMKSAEATGDVNVRLTGVPPEKACRTQSGKALYDPQRDTLTLSDWPKIKSQSQEQIAATAETTMNIVTKTGKMSTEGKALTRISKAFVTETTSSPAPAVPERRK